MHCYLEADSREFSHPDKLQFFDAIGLSPLLKPNQIGILACIGRDNEFPAPPVRQPPLLAILVKPTTPARAKLRL